VKLEQRGLLCGGVLGEQLDRLECGQHRDETGVIGRRTDWSEQFSGVRTLKTGWSRRDDRQPRRDVGARENECKIRRAIAKRPGPNQRGVIADDRDREINVHYIGGGVSDEDGGVRIEIAHPGDNRAARRDVEIGTQIYISDSCAHEVCEHRLRIGIICDEQNTRSEQALLRDTAESLDDNLPAVAFDLAIGQRHVMGSTREMRALCTTR